MLLWIGMSVATRIVWEQQLQLLLLLWLSLLLQIFGGGQNLVKANEHFWQPRQQTSFELVAGRIQIHSYLYHHHTQEVLDLLFS